MLTRLPGPVSARHAREFEAAGFAIVPGLFEPSEMETIRGWAAAAQAWDEVPGRHMMYFERSPAGERILNRLEDFVPYHEGFERLVNDERMLGAVSRLLGEPAVLFKDKINFKLPGGDGFAPHQDVQAGWAKYGSVHVTALLAIDSMTLENGCLELAPRIAPRLLGQEWAPLGEAELVDVQFEPLEASPGDAVFFDSYVPHRSGPNRSDSPRRVLYATYNKASEGDVRRAYYVDKRAGYPPDIEREPDREYRYRV